MYRPIKFMIRFMLILGIVNNAFAQDNTTTPNVQRIAPTVTAFASSEKARFTAPASVLQIRLEVYSSTGKKVFDNEVRGGNVLDWHLQDGQAERLADDTYLCVVTVKNLSGKISQRICSVIVEKNAVRAQAVAASQMTTQQSEAVGPVEEDASLVVLTEDERRTSTVISNNGEEGQITRGRGALSFRIGDFFAGKDQEQMRLTAEGNLGIGITHPTVKLDVDGLIRGSQGIIFPDGSVQYSAARKTFGAASLGPSKSGLVQGQAAAPASVTVGTGTTGKIPIWLDGPNGVLSDSNITESNSSIGVNGAPNTNFKLDVNGSVLFRGSNPGFNLVGLRPAGNQWVFQTVDDDGRFRLFSQDNVNPGVERFTIKLSNGNVGIGNTAPTFRLHVVDSANTGLRVQTNTGGGTLASFGGFGDFQIDAVNVVGGRLSLKENGNVGMGTNSPQARLDVRGNVKLGSIGQLFATGGDENLRIIRGSVDPNGNILAGSGFHVTHTQTGIYHIIFDTPFTSSPTVTATADSPGSVIDLIITQVAFVQQSLFHLYTIKEGDLLHSYAFHFIAVGPR